MGGSGCLPLKSQSTGQVGGKESLLCFRCWQLWGEGGGHLSKGRLPPTPTRQAGGKGLHAETADSSLNSHLQLVISGLTGIILDVSGPVYLQFQGALVPISLWSVLGIVAAHVLGTVCSPCT